MLELYFTDRENVYSELEKAVARHICGGFVIRKTENGKPYIEGNPLYFSLSHSKNKAVIALCNKPVGVDMELYGERKTESVLKRFTDREKGEIKGDAKKFLRNWTAKEAYVKMLGGTLSGYLKRLEYFQNAIFLDNIQQNCYICAHEYDFGIVTTCIQK